MDDPRPPTAAPSCGHRTRFTFLDDSASALAFAREGAGVVVADAETAHLIEKAGGHAVAVRCDVTRAEDVKAAVEAAVEAFGGLDVAFNNAGFEQPSSLAADISEKDWDRVLAVSLRGVFLSMKYEIQLMLQHGGGAIVNTSSGAGLKGFAGRSDLRCGEARHYRRDEMRCPRLRELRHPH